MKYRFVSYAMVCASAAGVLSLAFMPARAQNGTPAGTAACLGCSPDGKTTPRMADGHPDLNGHWGGGGGDSLSIVTKAADGSVLYDFAGADVDENGNTYASQPTPEGPVGPGHVSFNIGSSKPEDNAPYKPEYFAKAKKIGDETYGSANAADPNQACKPGGIPRAAFGEMQIVQTPGVIAIVFPEGMNDRLIYTDGRQHPKHLDTSFQGDSIGHWEGDTLVVDVAGLNDETWLAGSFSAPKYTNIHSDKEHVVERWTRAGDTLTYQATIEDPVMFTHPWVLKPRGIKHATADPTNDNGLMQFNCVPTDFGHLIKPTATDKYVCDYCNPDKFKNKTGTGSGTTGSSTSTTGSTTKK
jgi:hypothetical protein